MSTRTVTMTMTQDTARIVERACELYARAQMGQLDDVAAEVVAYHGDVNAYHGMRAELDAIAERLGIVPHRGAYYSITSEQVPDVARIAWDAYTVLRHAMTKALHPEGPPQGLRPCAWDEPRQYSTQVLPVVTQNRPSKPSETRS